MIAVTCAALAAAMMDPGSAGKQFRLSEDCRPVGGAWALSVRRPFSPAITIDAGQHTVHGINIEKGGGGIHWQGGTIVAPEGSRPSVRIHGYGVRIWAGSRDVRFDRTHFTDARKAIVTYKAADISVTNSRFDGPVEDGLIAAETRGIVFSRNKVGPLQIINSRCQLPGGMVEERVPRRKCEPRGGVWRDGWHADVLQIRDATTDVVAEYNEIDTPGQGLTNLDAKGDRPVARVRFSHNKIRAVQHWITIKQCEDCLINNNQLWKNDRWRAVVRPGTAKACGNKSADGGPGLEPC